MPFALALTPAISLSQWSPPGPRGWGVLCPWHLHCFPHLFPSAQQQKATEGGLLCHQVAFGSHLISFGWTFTMYPSLLWVQSGTPQWVTRAVATSSLLSGIPYISHKTHHSPLTKYPEVRSGQVGGQVKRLEQKEEPRGSARKRNHCRTAISPCSSVSSFYGGGDGTRRETCSLSLAPRF